MQESLKKNIAIRSIAKSFGLENETVLIILKSEKGMYPNQELLARSYIACLSSINESEQCFNVELEATFSDFGCATLEQELIL